MFSVKYINSVNKELLVYVSYCAESAEKEDTENLNSEYIKLKECWYNKRRIYNIILHKNYTDVFNKYIENLSLYLKNGDFAETVETLEECKRELEQINEREKINIENIL